MFRFVKAFKKWDKHHKGVSPVIAAILLIGLAVLAGAAVFFIVLPLLSGAADVSFTSMTASDSNDDGKVDTIKLSFTNSGTSPGEISEVDLSGLTGWSVTQPTGGTVTVNPGQTAEVTVKADSVTNQLFKTDSFSIVASLDGTPTFTINENTQAEDGKSFADATVKAISNSDLVITDYTTSSWITINGQGSISDTDTSEANRQTGTGSPGIRFRTSNGDEELFYQTTGSATNYISTNVFSASETTTWSKAENPVLAFWIKSDQDVDNSDFHMWVLVHAYSGSNSVGPFAYRINSYVAGLAQNQWTLVLVDFSDFNDPLFGAGPSPNTNWDNSYTADEQTALNAGDFAIGIENVSAGSNWDIYIDDIYVTGSL